MCSRTANLLGALGIALADAQTTELASSSGLAPTDAAEEVWQRQADARIEALERTIARLAPAERADVERVVSALLVAVTGDEESAERICRLCDEYRCPQDRCPVTLAIGVGT